MQRRCHSCGAENALGAHRAYQGAGVVLRCPACADVARAHRRARRRARLRVARDVHGSRSARRSASRVGAQDATPRYCSRSTVPSISP